MKRPRPLCLDLSPQALALLDQLVATGLYGTSPEDVARRLVDRALCEIVRMPPIELPRGAPVTDERDDDTGGTLLTFPIRGDQAPEPSKPEPPPNVVVAAFGRETKADLPYERGFCMHHQIRVNSAKRVITCTTCGDVLDPFDRMLEYARKERRWHDSEAAESKVRKRIAELEEEERKIKARMRNASRKDADAAVAAALEKQRSALRSAVYKAREVARLGEQIERLIGGKPEPVETPEVLKERERIAGKIRRCLHELFGKDATAEQARDALHRLLTRLGADEDSE